MERRKLIKFGKNSFVVSLPKEWITASRLTKGAELFLEQQSGSILITPGETAREEHQVTINCDGKSPGVLENEFTSSYKAGYNTIIFEGKTLPQCAGQIKNYIHLFAGVEIIEQDLHKMIVKDLIDIKQIALPTLINRMDMMIRTMFQDSIFETVPPDVLRERDRDINRLQFLAARVVRTVLSNPALGNRLGVSVTEAYYIDKVSWILERLGDYIKRANHDIQRAKSSTQKNLKSLLKDLYDKYLATMKAYYTRSVDMAVQVHDEVIHFFPDLTAELLTTKDTNHMLALENIKNMARDLRVILRSIIEMGKMKTKLGGRA